VVFVVDTAETILPSLDDFYAWTADDLGSQTEAWAELGARSLPARRKPLCHDHSPNPFGFGGDDAFELTQ
jgi:hypothetical protein